MKRILTILSPTAYFLLLLLVSCQVQEPEKPNIIFIFVDDQSYNTVHATGNQEINTPNLDKLAREGITFTHAYNMGAWHGAVCIASRTMINTGRFVWRARECEQTKMSPLVENGELWSQIMQRAGYETYFTGKWHVMNVDPEDIFNEVKHVRPGMPGTVEEAYNRPIAGEQDQWSPFDTTIGGFWEGGRHWSEVLADDAIEFIQQSSQKEAPFFMYMAFNAPHDPRQSPKEYVDMYPLENVEVPESYMPEYPYKDQIGCSEELRDEKLAPFPRTEYAVKVHRQEYYAIITHADAQVGRIIDALEKSGLSDRTYIFYTADHGLSCGNHGLMGKQNMFDHSLRTPLLVVGPNVAKGEKRDMDVYLQDIMPTTIEIAGSEVPGYVEFKSLLPMIRGEQEESSYPAVYGCYMDLQRMVRKDQYKLIAYPKVSKILLFDLQNDPLELNDLSEDPVHEKRIKDMFAELEEICSQMGDTLVLRDFYPGL
jgi:arylsulfatase A-like enzyme